MTTVLLGQATISVKSDENTPFVLFESKFGLRNLCGLSSSSEIFISKLSEKVCRVLDEDET